MPLVLLEQVPICVSILPIVLLNFVDRQATRWNSHLMKRCIEYFPVVHEIKQLAKEIIGEARLSSLKHPQGNWTDFQPYTIPLYQSKCSKCITLIVNFARYILLRVSWRIISLFETWGKKERHFLWNARENDDKNKSECLKAFFGSPEFCRVQCSDCEIRKSSFSWIALLRSKIPRRFEELYSYRVPKMLGKRVSRGKDV